MDEVWVRAVETALDGNTDFASVRTLTLDGAVKCVHGKLPYPLIFERFQNLQHLSIANIGVSSLEQFPRLRNLQKLILSDNRISGGLEFLVEVGLSSLRDLDLSNNRIQDVNDLRPLAELRIVSLDLYECPVTRAKDYRSMVFGLIKSLKYLDKMDADENERPESDDEEEDEEEDEGDDPGSGEIDGEELPYRINGQQDGSEGVVDVDEEESDADEEEMEITRGINRSKRNGLHHQFYDFKIEVGDEDDDDEDDDDWEGEDDDDDDNDDDSDNDSLEVIYEEGDEDDLVEVHEAEDSDDEDVVEEDGDEENEDEVDNDEENERTGRLVSTEGVIDGHEQGEDDGDEDDNGETGEDELGIEVDGDFDDEDEEEDNGAGYLVQPVGNVAVDEAEGGSDMDRNGHEDHPELEEEVEDEDGEVQELPPSSNKRKRDNDHGAGETKEEDDDRVENMKSSKHR